MVPPPNLQYCVPLPSGIGIPPEGEIMPTIRVKARPKPAEGKFNHNTAPLTRDSPAPGKDAAPKAAGDGQASCGSLREYLKLNH
jgi:hypothetical protein